MKKVIVAQKADERLIEKLRTAAEPVLMQEGDLETLEREIGGATAIILGTWLKFDREWIDKAPNLKVISRTGVGVGQCRRRVCLRKGYSGASHAEGKRRFRRRAHGGFDMRPG
jgi:Phosphoglycerate dehydrogenase and related dehydrogenases